MATYKVIQDIEAEDKLVGPLSLKQFIYASIAAIAGYLSFISASKGVSFLLVVLVPIALFAGFFAFPWGRDQPTEIWALAKIRYFLKPRSRIWNQSGVKELVNITVPKRIERMLTNNLTQTQVESRLTALASTLDSRGWAIKNVNLNLGVMPRATSDSDRLIGPSNIPQDVAMVDITSKDDILDASNNPQAQRLEQMISSSSQSRHTMLIDQLKKPVDSPMLPAPQVEGYSNGQSNTWFLKKPLDFQAATPTNNTPFVAPPVPGPSNSLQPSLPQAANPTPDEEAFAEELRQQREKAMHTGAYQHMKIVQPLSAQPQQSVAATADMPGQQTPPALPVTPPANPATMGLAARNDLTVATIANIANRQDTDTDEVVIKLHDRS